MCRASVEGWAKARPVVSGGGSMGNIYSLYDGLCYLGNKREQHTGEVPAPQKDQRAPLCFRQAVLWRKPGRMADSHVPFLFLVKQGRACYWPGANLR